MSVKRLGGMELVIFSYLERRQDRWVGIDELIRECYDGSRLPAYPKEAVRVRLVDMRRKLAGEFTILTKWHSGYKIKKISKT